MQFKSDLRPNGSDSNAFTLEFTKISGPTNKARLFSKV